MNEELEKVKVKPTTHVWQNKKLTTLWCPSNPHPIKNIYILACEIMQASQLRPIMPSYCLYC